MNTQNGKVISRIFKSIIAIFFQTVLLIISQGTSYASFTGVFGITFDDINAHPTSPTYCTPGQDIPNNQTESMFFVPGCTLNVSSNNYVPFTGGWAVSTQVSGTFLTASNTTDFVTLSSDIPLSEQNVSFPSRGGASLGQKTYGKLCFYLYSSINGQYYSLNGFDYTGCPNSDKPPIPPDPPAPPTSCTINNSNTLNVNLGNVDRALLVTVPGTGSARHIQIPVQCTGGQNVPVNMTLSYTALNVSGKQVIQSSSNGLGISIIYNDQVLSPTDVTAIQFVSGSNEVDLAFEAIRDPNVIVGDVPTGAFTASATVIMTQQ
jgi:hypothetical protein